MVDVKKILERKKTWLAIAAAATAIGGYVAGDLTINDAIQKITTVLFGAL